MRNTAAFRTFVLSILLALTTGAAYAQRCPVSHKPLPTAAQRQFIIPEKLLTCFMSLAEIDLVRSSIGHDAQTTVSDPQFDSGELNPDGSTRPPLSS